MRFDGHFYLSAKRVQSNPAFKVARNHYEQASRTFEREDWEAGDAHLTQLVDPSPPVLTPREFIQSRK